MGECKPDGNIPNSLLRLLPLLMSKERILSIDDDRLELAGSDAAWDRHASVACASMP